MSDEQVAAFGRFNGVPSGPELERFFFLDDADLDLIAKRRNSHNQLGFALQLGTVRYLGTFLPDPLEVLEASGALPPDLGHGGKARWRACRSACRRRVKTGQ